jgi:hypothetical protein
LGVINGNCSIYISILKIRLCRNTNRKLAGNGGIHKMRKSLLGHLYNHIKDFAKGVLEDAVVENIKKQISEYLSLFI